MPFGSNGVVTTLFSEELTGDVGRGVAVQGDGKIVVVGDIYSGEFNRDFGVVRYSPDGTLDSSFGTGGKLTLDFFDSYDSAECVAIQADGKLVIGGRLRIGNEDRLALVRIIP